MTDTKEREESRPIFITGSVRSGTSIMNKALIKGAGIPGYLEGCFINLLGDFLRAIDDNRSRRGRQLIDPRIMISRVNKKDFSNNLALWFKDQYESKTKYSGRWVDKTADIGLLYGLPYVSKVWPKAKFIIMNRRPVENISSRIKKFPQRSFHEHCEGWKKATETWIESKKNLPPSVYIEIDQRDVALNPDVVADKVSEFLDFNREQRDSVAKVFKQDRPENTGGDESVVKSLEDMDWTDEEKDFFEKTCGPLAKKCGYGLGNQYYE